MLESIGHELFSEFMVVRINDIAYLLEMGGNLLGLLQYLCVLPAERLCDGMHHFREPRSTIPIGGWIIGPAVERFQIGGKKDGHGPAALTRHDLDSVHVDFI